MLEVSTKELNRCDIVRAKGRIDSETVKLLGSEFSKITDRHRYKIVFNLSGVAFLSSAGLRQMIETRQKCQRLNRGNLVLTEVPENIAGVLDLAGLTPIFTIYESEVDAVDKF